MFTAAQIAELEHKWAEASRRYWASPECKLCHTRHAATVTCEGEGVAEAERVARQKDCAHNEVTRRSVGGYLCDLCGLYLFPLPEAEKPELYAIHDPAKPTTTPDAATWRCANCGLPNPNINRVCYHCESNRDLVGGEAEGRGAVDNEIPAAPEKLRRAL